VYSFVIINYGTPTLVKNLLNSIQTYTDIDSLSEVVIVDNGHPEKCDMGKELQGSDYSFNVIFVKNTQHSYSSGVNKGVAATSSEIVVISNSDIEILKDNDPKKLVKFLLENNNYGIVGTQQLYPNGTWQRSYGDIPSITSAIKSILFMDSIENIVESQHFKKRKNVITLTRKKYIDGAFLCVKKECFEELSGFDNSFSFYGEETDFCLRVSKRGWNLAVLTNINIMHIRGASFDKTKLLKQSRKLYNGKLQFISKHNHRFYVAIYKALTNFSIRWRFLISNILTMVICNQKIKKMKYNALLNYEALIKEEM
jgi:GT2 family glycosyltransferase